MKAESLENWLEFSNLIDEKFQLLRKNKTIASQPLFRGQAQSDWELKTTLERYCPEETMTFEKYDTLIREAGGQISSLCDYDIKFDENYREPDEKACISDELQNIGEMMWLRQNGFPSPLLDWSRSPYIAAFFAFYEASKNDTENVSIFLFIDSTTGVKTGNQHEPSIVVSKGNYFTDRKHYNQQSAYTTCRMKTHGSDGSWRYLEHSDGFKTHANDPQQNNLAKYNIPVSQKNTFLNNLSLMGITESSLFGSLSATLNTIARDIFIKKFPHSFR